LHNLALFRVKNANCFAEFFSENILKNPNIGPWSTSQQEGHKGLLSWWVLRIENVVARRGILEKGVPKRGFVDPRTIIPMK
jgi:hypothetical protein